ncbi:hypothetical protein GCM10025734_44620 [Kitasatospora paranensis]
MWLAEERDRMKARCSSRVIVLRRRLMLGCSSWVGRAGGEVTVTLAPEWSVFDGAGPGLSTARCPPRLPVHK